MRSQVSRVMLQHSLCGNLSSEDAHEFAGLGCWQHWTPLADLGTVQLISEVRQPLPPEPGQPERFDYEYQRNGTSPDTSYTHSSIWRQQSTKAMNNDHNYKQEIPQKKPIYRK